MQVQKFFHVFLMLLVIGILPHLIVWTNHVFVFGLNPFVRPVILTIVLLVFLFLVIRWDSWLRKKWFPKDDQEPVILFTTAALCWVISYMLSGNSTADIQLHDTYYIIPLYNLSIYLAAAFGLFGFIYFLFSRPGRRDLNSKLSRFHFWVTYIGLVLLVIGYTERVTDISRRYVYNAGWVDYRSFQMVNAYLIVLVSLVLIAQLVFLLNVADVVLRKRK